MSCYVMVCNGMVCYNALIIFVSILNFIILSISILNSIYIYLFFFFYIIISILLDDDDDPLVREWTFSPEKGNVIFASAIDCWGFGTARFATIWANKLGLNKNILQKHIFDDFSYNSKTKKLTKCSNDSSGSEPLFATMILDPIWKIYDACVVQGNPEKASKMAERGVSWK